MAVFAHELRQLRRAAGAPSYRALARKAGYSAAALSAAAGGVTFPSLSVTLAYVGACGGNTDEWTHRWQELEAKLSVDGVPARRPAAGTGVKLARPDLVPPRELPPDVYAFAGRSAELAELDRIAAGTGRPGSVIMVVSGTAGVGKTALAVHWSHRAADRYPDGQLYVDLRGYGPEPPTDPGEVLAGFLRALGASPADVPYDLAERSARYRSLLADRRVLVLLDNAHSAEAVRPLLPGSPTCITVVTSRDSLAGLVARHGARRLDVPRLPAPEALDLLGTLIGSRVAAEPVPAVALMEGCARLPLALRVAAELAATRPASSLADLVTELGDERSRLERLAAGADERTAVGSVLSWSYHRLTACEASLFRLVGLHPGPDLDALAAAALAGIPLADARRELGALVRAHLVEPVDADRYGQHDLLRAYAATRGEEEDPPDARVAALTRLLDHYLASAVAAMDALVPADRAFRPPVSAPAPEFADATAARAWLDAHRATLVAVVAYASERGWPMQAAWLAETLWRYFDTGGHYLDALATQDHALAIARDRGERGAEAVALHHIATVQRRWGRYDEAADYCRQALAIQREIGDLMGMGASLNTLGVLSRRQGRYGDAVEYYQQSLDSHQAAGDPVGVGLALGNLAVVYDQLGRYAESVAHNQRALELLRQRDELGDVGIVLGNLGTSYAGNGDYAQAVEHLEQALRVVRELGNRAAEGDFLDELGSVHHRWGDAEKAHAYLQQAFAIHRELGNRDGQATSLARLAAVYLRADRPAEALRYGRQALDVAREIGERRVEAAALNTIGATLTRLGQPGNALRHHEEALPLTEALDDRYGRVRGLEALGRALLALGRRDEARQRWEQALELLGDLAVPEADELRVHLADFA